MERLFLAGLLRILATGSNLGFCRFQSGAEQLERELFCCPFVVCTELQRRALLLQIANELSAKPEKQMRIRFCEKLLQAGDGNHFEHQKPAFDFALRRNGKTLTAPL
ncbi:hypothetical protein [Rhizobium sp. H4]|uniref:hypothetical protein n=1 Tax=Rhizobium sp. H4 TaxID=2035449 RepID=UPI0014850D91|nr:hypothetical protein [Rhizobium sp. H4]